MRVAAIDIGTNSVLLLVAERRGDDVVPIVERATITRLGQGVDRTRTLAPEAVQRTLACLERYAEELRSAGASRVDAVGTSAMRDAAGGDAFVARARELLGVAPRVVSGEEEARLSFSGALSGLRLADGPVAVFDVGGGSTELIRGELTAGEPVVHAATSLDVGAVRLTERHIRSDPPSPPELDAVRADARRALASASFGDPGARLVGVAGTVTTLAAVARAIVPYDAARIHGATLTADELRATGTRLAALPVAERRRVPGLDPARADVIVAGAVLVDEVLRAARGDAHGAELVVSDRGVRWGVARALLA
jgi:exopolyphosphatase/guanosine-5'-triphosphate,3'-diphosphate pyrophosphatase